MPACPSCGKDDPKGFQFCGYCSAPLAPVVRRGEERKVVSVLFCDVVGFTSTSERSDPENVQAPMQPYYARLRREIEGFGGTVEKFIGDAVMAVFGAPVAHEDDAERAVRAGLRILEAITELNESDPGLDLSVRIGVNTGVVMVTLDASPESGEAAVLGDAVNTAARIQTSAPVDGVAVGEGTYRATKLVFEYEPLEPVTAKGKSAPLELWRATSARARFGSDVIRSMASPLVGRETDLLLLRGTFDKSVRERSTQLVTVVGEPGLGKSRLVAELFAYIDGLPGLRRLETGPLPSVWRRNYLLGPWRDRQGPCRGSTSPIRRREAERKLEVVLPEGEGHRVATRGSPCSVSTRRLGLEGRVVHGLEASCRVDRGGRALRSRLRGRPLGGRGAARIRRVPRGLGARRASAPRLHRSARAVRATSVVGRGAPQCDDHRA